MKRYYHQKMNAIGVSAEGTVGDATIIQQKPGS